MQSDPFANITNSPVFGHLFDISFYASKITGFFEWLKSWHAASIIYLVSYILSLFGITIIIYSIVRIIEIQIEEHEHLKHEIAELHERDVERAGGRNERWEHIQDLVNSIHASDWRLAIIEADTVLEGLLEARDFIGKNIGEKLKSITPGDLSSLQAAWDAHLVRNRIAHEGSAYNLSQHEARRTIQLYEVVFRELGFVS